MVKVYTLTSDSNNYSPSRSHVTGCSRTVWSQFGGTISLLLRYCTLSANTHQESRYSPCYVLQRGRSLSVATYKTEHCRSHPSFPMLSFAFVLVLSTTVVAIFAVPIGVRGGRGFGGLSRGACSTSSLFRHGVSVF